MRNSSPVQNNSSHSSLLARYWVSMPVVCNGSRGHWLHVNYMYVLPTRYCCAGMVLPVCLRRWFPPAKIAKWDLNQNCTNLILVIEESDLSLSKQNLQTCEDSLLDAAITASQPRRRHDRRCDDTTIGRNQSANQSHPLIAAPGRCGDVQSS